MTVTGAQEPGTATAADESGAGSGGPAVDHRLAGTVAAAARAVPGVREAAAVIGRGVRGAAPAEASGTPGDGREPGRERPRPAASTTSSEVYGGDPYVPEGAASTVQEALRQAAALTPDKGTVFLREGSEPDFQSYPRLLQDAERVLAGLRAEGLAPGDAALFQFDDHRGYMTAFWACVMGGFVPTPVAVAASFTAHNAANRKLQGAWNLLGRPVLLTDAATAPALREVRTLWDEPDVRVLTVEELSAHERDGDWYPSAADTPVINLLTSGSTGVPKCVQHTNASITARTWAIVQACGYTTDDVTLMWMPLDHVTMLYYNIRDVFLRCQHVNARISDFLADPLLWLDWLERYRATNSWAPNFAFGLVVQQADEIARRSWDLSRVRQLDNAGEPVIAATNLRFLDLLAPHGLPANAVAPVWGMSETCSVVTLSRLDRENRTAGTLAVAGSSLDGDLRFLDADERGGQDAVVFASVGPPVPGMTMRVVDPDGAVLTEDRVGELQTRGATMMRGYHGNPEANREAWDPDGWFRTGDLAFVHGGEVVIAGRKKDQIVVRGTNYIAHELEYVVEQAEGVRVTFSAAAGVRRGGEGSDRLVVFFVPARWDTDSLAATFQEIRARLVREVGLAPDVLVPLAEGEFRKTASGKIQRAALVADLRAGRFDDRLEQEEEPPAPQTLFSTRLWTPLERPDTPVQALDGVTVLLADGPHHARLGLGDRPTVLVTRGEDYLREAPDRYRVAPGEADQLRRVLDEAAAEHGRIAAVVLAWTLPDDGDAGTDDPAARLTEATGHLTALLRAWDGEEPAGATGRPLLLVLTAGAVHVRDGDHVDLGVCALPGLVHTAAAETPRLTVRQLDLPADRDGWAGALREELADPARPGVLAAREGLRWQRRLRPVPDDEPAGPPPLAPGGVYLVTGGLGGIARDLAGYLLAAYGARLVLVGRSPARGAAAEALAELGGLGEVMYHRADVTDPLALEEAATAAEKHWGRPLDGVLHLAAASVADQWTDLEAHTLAREDARGFARQYAAKVTGTLALARLLEDRPEASLTLFGSVNGEFGGRSFGAYAAASAFLTGFADHWHHERGRPVRCLAWSAWEDTGMNQGRSTAPARRRGFLPIDPDDGLRAFLTATALPHHYLMIGLDLANPLILDDVAADELKPRELLVAYTGEGTDPRTVRAALEPVLRGLPVPVRVTEVSRIPRDASGAVDTVQLLMDAAPSRSGRTAYEAPRTDLERQVARIWSDVVGRPDIGRSDSFFDLGGSSLHATRLLARIGERLEVRLSTGELYENPTVAGVAAVIAAR